MTKETREFYAKLWLQMTPKMQERHHGFKKYVEEFKGLKLPDEKKPEKQKSIVEKLGLKSVEERVAEKEAKSKAAEKVAVVGETYDR